MLELEEGKPSLIEVNGEMEYIYIYIREEDKISWNGDDGDMM